MGILSAAVAVKVMRQLEADCNGYDHSSCRFPSDWRCIMYGQFLLLNRRAGVLFLVSGFAAFFAVAQSPPIDQQKQSPSRRDAKKQVLPLDPLTADDRGLAEKIAREDPRVRELLGEGPRPVSIALLFLKPEHEMSAAPTKPVAMDRYA